MSANDDDRDDRPAKAPDLPLDPQLPNPPDPRKSMEIRAPDTNMPDPPRGC